MSRKPRAVHDIDNLIKMEPSLGLSSFRYGSYKLRSAGEQLRRSGADWRDDLDALAFCPAAHDGWCVVHRLAFRRLLGFTPAPHDCMAFFKEYARTFQSAANTKIAGRHLPPDANFHLTSRDLAWALGNISRP